MPDGADTAATSRPGATTRLAALADACLPAALGLGFAGALLVFIVLPVARVLVTSFQGETGLTLAHYAKFFRTTYFLLSLRNSVVLAVVVTLLAVGIGFAVALAVTRGPRRLRWPFRLVALLPLVAPSYVFGVALIILGGRRGLVNQALGTDVRILGWPGVIMGQALTLFPLAFLMIENVLATLDRNLEDGASDLGASDLQVLRTITLPLVAPGLLKAAVMIFALSMADFATPAVLGGGLAFLAQDALLLVIGAEYDLAMASVLSSAALLGGTCTAMILGHWYLVIPSMQVSHLQSIVKVHIASMVVRVVVVVAAIFVAIVTWQPGVGPNFERYIFSVEGIFFWQRVLFGLAPVLLAYLTWETAKIRSTQSATGILYVDFFTVVVAEVLAKYLLLATRVPV